MRVEDLHSYTFCFTDVADLAAYGLLPSLLQPATLWDTHTVGESLRGTSGHRGLQGPQ